MVIFINDIILCDWLCFIIFAPIWIAQIVKNAYGNFKNTPNISYAISISAYMLYMPLYLRLWPGDFFYFKPNYVFSFALLIFTALQMCILKY